ncbi:hypothetical protein IE4872_PD00491 (plasmid) [Rhizobium gallicum]|uniref:Uncharacterized protein n=1 Tax=Rhizobium gallicum TaxID=56730 RepID=A0A1L5NSZ8_9HYPH|nr:hypothetical protein IE4872_PD00491 [Rhizobium gallicum]
MIWLIAAHVANSKIELVRSTPSRGVPPPNSPVIRRCPYSDGQNGIMIQHDA